MIIDSLPSLKSLAQEVDLQATIMNFIELLPMGPMSPLHMPMEFRGSRRQDKEGDVLLPASLLKHGLKLRASIHLHRLNGEGHPLNIVSRKP